MKRIFFCITLVLALAFSVACEKKAEPVPFDLGPSFIPEDADIPYDPSDPGDGHFSGGRGTQASPYLIAEAKDLAELRDLIDSDEYANFADKFYLQTTDIDYENATIRTISTESAQVFKGTYDGGGFEIRNAVFTRTYDRVALFGGCEGATIKRLHFKNCSVTQAKRGAAFVAGWAKNTVIEDCHVSGGSVVSKWTAAGSIVGEGKGITVRNCTSDAAITGSNGSSYSGAGGIVGYLDGDPSTISGCVFTGTVSVNDEASTEVSVCRAGGIVGSCGASVIENCRFKGSITCVGSQVGGIVGNAEASANNPGIIRSCTVTDAALSSEQWGCAGIIARNYGMNVQQCQVSGTTIRSADNNAGGIVGINKYNLRIADCSVATSTIEAAGTKGGGIIAEMGSAGTDYHAYVTTCQVTGSTVKSKYYTGGVAGYIAQGNVIDRCFVTSTDVTSTAGGEAGGIVGKTAADGIVIINCMYWDGTVQGATATSGIGGIVGSFFNVGGNPTEGASTGKTVVANCMANPTKLMNLATTATNANLGGIAGYMAYTKMNNCYSPIASGNVSFSGTDADDKRGSLFGALNFGGEVLNGYWLDGFKQGFSYSGATYTLKTQKARDAQMQQKDATSNVFWVPSLYPDGDYRQADMTAALNKGATLYNEASPLYGVTAKTWVLTTAYAYPVLAGSPLDGGYSPSASIRVGIIGDSISTFQGYSGGSYQYPKAEYESFTVQDTWWHQLIYSKMSGACLDINTSNCGSTVQKHESKGQPSFLDRYSKLVSPTVILINGGTNDSWSYRLPLGSLDFSLPLASLDEYQFAQAYDKLVRLCQRDYPSAQIILMIGDCLRDFPTYAQVIKDVAQHYDLHTITIDFGDRRSSLTYQRTGTSDVNVHPNKAGMTEMANQAWAQMSAW
ncbi:MAG: hypothetical protein K5651_07260 [Bacteroidales bacterium]|nr:hypothetical protein [Bacteroidales bacterium]